MNQVLILLLAITFGVSATPLFQVRREPANELASRQFTAADNSSRLLVYYGGPVLTKVEVQPLFYGTFSAETKSTLSGFYSFLTNSAYSDFIADEWSVTGQAIQRGSVLPSISFSGPLVDSLDDAKYTKPLLRSLIKAGTIKPNSNSYYPIYLGMGVNATQGSHMACVNFCGYHGTVDISDISSTKYLYYAILPDQSDWCMGGCGDSEDPFENLMSISAHEFAEAVTNPAIGVAKSLGSPLSWYLMGEGETGDITSHAGNTIQDTMTDSTTGKTWVVQKLWSNKYQMCMSQSPNSNAAKVLVSSSTVAAVTTSKTVGSINSAGTSKSSGSINAAPKPATTKAAYVANKKATTTKKVTATKKVNTTTKKAVKTTKKK
ncbi:hypothetical protein HDU81_009224 [Chytriomyces hyalinus]|nr:hypothetical protein HDU81_009224 [Chytriomyces hyalinus]